MCVAVAPFRTSTPSLSVSFLIPLRGARFPFLLGGANGGMLLAFCTWHQYRGFKSAMPSSQFPKKRKRFASGTKKVFSSEAAVDGVLWQICNFPLHSSSRTTVWFGSIVLFSPPPLRHLFANKQALISNETRLESREGKGKCFSLVSSRKNQKAEEGGDQAGIGDHWWEEEEAS